MRAAFEEGLPLIYLQENGFTDLAKPGGKRMEACAKGQLLILAPWEHHNEKLVIKRGQCLELNEMARHNWLQLLYLRRHLVAQSFVACQVSLS